MYYSFVELPVSGISDLVDITKVWVCNETDETVNIIIQVKDLSSDIQKMFLLEYSTYFIIGDYCYIVDAFGENSVEDMNYNLRRYLITEDGFKPVGDFDITGKAYLDTNVIAFLIPKNLLKYPTNGAILDIQGSTSYMLIYPPAGPCISIGDSSEKGRMYSFQYDTKSDLYIYLTPEQLSVEAGDTATINVDIKNEGNDIAENVALQINGVSYWNYSFNPNTISISAHSANTSILTINVPENVSDADIEIIVTASSNIGKTNSKAMLSVTGKKVVQVQVNNNEEENPPLTTKEENSTDIPGFECFLATLAIGAIYCIKKKRR